MKDKALKQALEFLEKLGENHWGNRPDVIATIKEALAETDSEEIETLVYMAGLRDGKKMEREKPTHPNLEKILNRAGFYRRREWEGLTDDFYYIEGSREAERISIPPTTEPFKPDYNTEAVLVEEMQRMAKRLEDLEAMLERQTARIVELQEHIENFDGEDR